MHPRPLRALAARVVAVASAGLVAAGLATVPAAHANPDVPEIDPSSITANTTGSITVHSHDSSASTGFHGNGLPDPAVDASTDTALDGVTFTASRLANFDLTTQAGWTALAQLNGTLPLDGPAYEAGQSATTGTDGIAKFENLKIGAYRVCDTSDVANPADCFLITVPMTHPTDLDHWMYDVHAYPKKTDAAIDKSFNGKAGLASGDTMTWDIDTTLPGRNDSFTVDALVVKDAYVGALLDTSVKAYYGTPGAGSDIDWTESTPADGHFTVAKPTDGDDSGTITAEWTAAGIAHLNSSAAQGVKHIRVQVSGTYDSLAAPAPESLVDTATATVTMANKDSEKTTYTESVKLEALFGDITVQKTAAQGTSPQGAEFVLFTTEAHAQAYVNATTQAERDIALAKAKSFQVRNAAGTGWDTTQSVVADAAGTAVFPAIWFETLKDDQPAGSAVGPYFIVESKAPVGNELSPEIAKVELTGDTTVQFTNVAHNAGFELPLAGGAGYAAVGIGGLALIATAYAVLRRERTRGQDA